MKTIETIDISDVSLFAGTQVRTKPDEVAVIKYHESMEDAGTNTMFPPIIVYRDTTGNLWIADGHHRVQASIRSRLRTIVAEVRDGEKAEAIREAVLANRHNGVPLSKADRFKAMEMLLETSPELTDGALAELLGMPRKTVHDWRKQIQCGDIATLNNKRIRKDGKSYPASINKKPKPAPSTSEAVVRGVKPPCSPVSPSPVKPPQPTTSSQGSQPAQTSPPLDDELPERIDSVWRELAEQLTPFQNRLNEYRSIYGDCGYQERIHELFDI